MDSERVKKAVRELLEAAGENPDSPELKETPKRFADLFQKLMSGKTTDEKEILKTSHELKHDEMILIKDIPFYSLCEHHLLPFFGKCHVAYIPDKNKIAGLGRIAELVESKSKKLQIQERLTTEIAKSIMDNLEPKGVGVVLEATHLCMEMAETKHTGAKVVTSAVHGLFRQDQKTREEFLQLIKD